MEFEFDYSKLKGLIIEKYGALKYFYKALKVSNVAYVSKLHSKTYFNQKDIFRICNLLNIKAEDIPLYFFNQKVSKTEQEG